MPNPHDAVSLRLDGLLDAAAELATHKADVAAAAARAPWRRAAAASLGPPPAAGVRLLASSPHADGRLLAEARILAAGGADELRGRDAASLRDPARPLPPASESRALRTLAAAAVMTLGSFPTPADADRAALAGGGLPADVAAAIAVRLAAKDCVDAAARGLGKAAVAAAAAKKEVKEAGGSPPAPRRAGGGKGFGGAK